MLSNKPTRVFYSPWCNIVKNVRDGAIEIINSENDAKSAGNMETCSSSSSEKEQDLAVQTANDPEPEVIAKAQHLINTQSRIKQADEVEAELSPRQ